MLCSGLAEPFLVVGYAPHFRTEVISSAQVSVVLVILCCHSWPCVVGAACLLQDGVPGEPLATGSLIYKVEGQSLAAPAWAVQPHPEVAHGPVLSTLRLEGLVGSWVGVGVGVSLAEDRLCSW